MPTTGEKPKKLFVALPIYRDVDPYFMRSVVALAAGYDRLGFNIQVCPSNGDSLINRARNSLTAQFLKSDCTHMLFIDCDLVFSLDHIARIMSHDVDVVGGIYTKKQEGDVCIVANRLEGDVEQRGDLMPVKYIGTGFMCISRRVFEVMTEKYGDDMWYARDDRPDVLEQDFWRSAPYQYTDGTRRYLSEDWWFCQRWLDCGGLVYMDLKMVLKHSGMAIYPLAYQENQLFNRGTVPVEKSAGDSAAPPPRIAEDLPALQSTEASRILQPT
jgi:hypothetical protein